MGAARVGGLVQTGHHIGTASTSQHRRSDSGRVTTFYCVVHHNDTGPQRSNDQAGVKDFGDHVNMNGLFRFTHCVVNRSDETGIRRHQDTGDPIGLFMGSMQTSALL